MMIICNKARKNQKKLPIKYEELTNTLRQGEFDVQMASYGLLVVE